MEKRQVRVDSNTDMTFDRSMDDNSTLRVPNKDAKEHGRKSTLQKFSKDVLIKHLEISDYDEKDSHVAYIIKVKGRTKYLVNLPDLETVGLIDSTSYETYTQTEWENSQKYQLVEYTIVKRYSELLVFNNLLKSELKNYMKKRGMNPDDFPDFPPKKAFFNKSKKFIQQRIQQINVYFAEIFQKYPLKVPYTNAIIDLCQPFKLNIALIGQGKTGKSTLIESVVNLLMDYKSNLEYFEKKGYGNID